MKTKAYLLALGLTLTSFAISGCYTQLARPVQEDEPEAAAVQEEYAEQEEEAAYADTNYDDERDRPEVTNIYIYDHYRYDVWDPWDPWDPWYYSWYYRHHPRNRFYLSIGWGAYYDYWNWCGTRWAGYWDPWDWNYYSWWGPRPYYQPGWIYYPDSPIYDPGVSGKKRDFGRRGSRGSGDDFGDRRGSIGQPIADRNSISKPGETVFDRAADGSYRRQRRSDVNDTRERTTTDQGQNTDRRRVSRRSTEDRATDAVTSPRANDRTYTAPSTSKRTDSVSKPKSSGKRESATRREGRKSSNEGSSSRRVAPARESSSSSAPSVQSSGSSSGNSGSSSRGSSSSGSKSSNSGSSSRRDKN